MHCLIRCAGIENCGNRINDRDLTVDHLETCRRIHPGVGGDDKPRRGKATNPDGEGTEPVYQGRDTIPPIQIDTEEDRFYEEGKPLKGKEWTNHSTDIANVDGPEQTKFKFDNCAGDRSNGEDDNGCP